MNHAVAVDAGTINQLLIDDTAPIANAVFVGNKPNIVLNIFITIIK